MRLPDSRCRPAARARATGAAAGAGQTHSRGVVAERRAAVRRLDKSIAAACAARSRASGNWPPDLRAWAGHVALYQWGLSECDALG